MRGERRYLPVSVPGNGDEPTRWFVHDRLKKESTPAAGRDEAVVRAHELNEATRWLWPLRDAPCLWPDEPGRFGVRRRFDTHTGVDLYAEPGTEVVAVEAGRVVLVENFTGPKADSPWWHDTQAVLVEGESGVVCYGEMTPVVEFEADVARGEFLGHVKRVLRNDKGRPTSMLHVELYVTGTRETAHWGLDAPQPEELLDPTPQLLDALAQARDRSVVVESLEDGDD